MVCLDVRGTADTAILNRFPALAAFRLAVSGPGRKVQIRTHRATTVVTLFHGVQLYPCRNGWFNEHPAVGGLPFGGPQNTIQWNQDLNWVEGKHSMEFGAQIIYIQDNNAYGAYAQATEQLGSTAASGIQNLVTGNLVNFQGAVNPNGALPCVEDPYTGALTQTADCSITLPATAPSFARSDRFHDWALYAQDAFKVTPSLPSTTAFATSTTTTRTSIPTTTTVPDPTISSKSAMARYLLLRTVPSMAFGILSMERFRRASDLPTICPGIGALGAVPCRLLACAMSMRIFAPRRRSSTWNVSWQQIPYCPSSMLARVACTCTTSRTSTSGQRQCLCRRSAL